MKNDVAKTQDKKAAKVIIPESNEPAIPIVTPYSLLCGLVRIAASLYSSTAAVMWSAERKGRGALVTFYGLSDNDAIALDIDGYESTEGSPPVHTPDSGYLHVVSDVIGGEFIMGSTQPGCRIMILHKEPMDKNERLDGIIQILADQATSLIGLPRREVITRTDVLKVKQAAPIGIEAGDGVDFEVEEPSDHAMVLFRAHPAPSFVFDRSTLNILDVNDAVVEQYGYSREELIGMNIRAMRPAEDVARLEMSITRDVEGRNSRWTHIKKNGEQITVQIDRTNIIYEGRECMLSVAQDVTARVATENELKATQERFRLVTENISDMIMMIDHDGNVRYVSPASTRVLGLSPEDLVGSHFIERIHPDDEARVIDSLLEGFVERGVSKPIEFRLQNTDGEWLKFESVANNQFDTPGLDSLVVAVRDISRQERDASQIQLREQALEAVANGVVIVDAQKPDMPVVYVNKAFEDITGYTFDDVVKRNLRMLNSADRDQTELQRLRDAISNQRETTVVLKNFRKDGSEFWNELHISPIFAGDGQLTHYVGVQTDITERKQIIEKLAETEERYRILVGGAAQIDWVCDSISGEASYFNAGSSLGVSSRSAWLQCVHPDDKQLVEEMWADAATSTSQRECQHRLKRDGKFCHVYSKVMPLLDSEGNVREWIGMSINAPEHDSIQTALVSKEKLAALGELISGMASEISSPLQAVSSAAQHLETSFDPKTVKTGSAILDLTRRIESIVDSLSVFARQGDELRVEGNLNHAILSIASLLRFPLKRASVKLELDLDESLPNTRFNVSQVEKLLINIVENAIDSLKLSKADKRLIRIATGRDSLSGGRSCSFVSITDTGSGIDSDSVASIFDPFFTTKNDLGSVGLGLSICQGIVKSHGGSIDVESSLGHGATFVIRLPIDDQPAVSFPLAA